MLQECFKTCISIKTNPSLLKKNPRTDSKLKSYYTNIRVCKTVFLVYLFLLITTFAPVTWTVCSSHKLFKCTKSYPDKYMLCSVYNNSWNISHPLSCPKDIAEKTCPYPSCCQVTENYIFTSWTSLVRLPMRIYLPQYLSNCFSNILISYLKWVEWQSCHSS